MVRVLFITKRHYTNKDLILDRFGRLFHIPFQLKENGSKVVVLTVNYRSCTIERHHIAGLEFVSIPFINPVLFLFQVLKTVKRFSPDIVVAGGDSHLGYIGLRLAKLRGIPLIFDIYDDYRVFGSNRLPLMKRLFIKTVKQSDCIFCASMPLMNELSRFCRIATLIPNGFDAELFKPMPKVKARLYLGIDAHETVIGYFGSMADNYGIETLIETSIALKNRTRNLRLLMAGAKNRSISLSHSVVDYRGVLPQKDVPFLINASDVVVVPYWKSPQINVSDPCKLSEYMACQVPIVSTNVTHLGTALSSIPEALCKPGDAEDMARAITWQLNNRKCLEPQENLRWESIGKKVQQMVERLTIGSKP